MCSKISNSSIETIIQRLEDAVNVCYTAPENPKEQGYPYATGYSKAAMQGAIESLQTLMQYDTEYS